jgi:phenylpropionate dioxygenase-like ring-hydroxylating dioxygenase large terminal subunit
VTAPLLLGNTEPALARAWHPVATVAALDATAGAPLRILLLGKPWVLVRLDGEVRAFPDRCPHRRIPLSAGTVVTGAQGEELRCAYHGWQFDGSGACTTVPALGAGIAPPRGMRVSAAHGVCERYGLIWLAPEAPQAPMVELPECDDPAFAWAILPPRSTPVSAGVVIDNFFDVAHFSYLHSKTFGLKDPVTVERYELSRSGWRAALTHETHLRADEGGLRRVATYSMTAPFGMHLRLEFPDTGERTMVAFVAQPASADTTVIYKLVALTASTGPEALQEMVDFEIAVLEEDLAMLVLLDEPELPLDLRAELHTKADRATVELRRMLTEFCLAEGPAHTDRR